MSHYTVLVIGEDIEEQLAPFDENIQVPKYKQGIVSEEDKKSFIECYTIYDEKRTWGVKSKEEAEKNSKLSFDKLYKKFGKDWNENTWEKDENGIWTEYSTYNPISKWDWYTVGGRWAGTFKIKKNFQKLYNEEPNFSWGWSEEDKKEILKEKKTDSALKGHIDWTISEKDKKHSKRFWEVYVEGDKPKNKEEEKYNESFYKKEYFIERYGTKKTYINQTTDFSTYAVLKDGMWYEAGEMGWFGCSSASPEKQKKFHESYYDNFIKDLSDDTRLTIVDCHI
jgi:hypothetical protein